MTIAITITDHTQAEAERLICHITLARDAGATHCHGSACSAWIWTQPPRSCVRIRQECATVSETELARGAARVRLMTGDPDPKPAGSSGPFTLHSKGAAVTCHTLVYDVQRDDGARGCCGLARRPAFVADIRPGDHE